MAVAGSFKAKILDLIYEQDSGCASKTVKCWDAGKRPKAENVGDACPGGVSAGSPGHGRYLREGGRKGALLFYFRLRGGYNRSDDWAAGIADTLSLLQPAFEPGHQWTQV